MAEIRMVVWITECPSKEGKARLRIPRPRRNAPGDRFQSAREFGAALQSILDDSAQASSAVVRRSRRRRVIYAATAAVLVLASVGIFSWQRASSARAARQQLLPEIERLAADIPFNGEGPNGWTAYGLARQAEVSIPGDPTLGRLWAAISGPVEISSDPPGARVLAKPYGQPDAKWTLFGQTPLAEPRFPKGFSRIRLELEGRETVDDVLWTLERSRSYRLQPAGSSPQGIIFVDGTEYSLHAVGLDHLPAERVDDFYIDRHEVTNQEYKRFVDGGGYSRQALWRHPFVKDGRTLRWAEAMALFTDKTGRPGPSNWEVGDYPEGQDDHPATGVSWYEAAAFAEFSGKHLPTIFHWDLVGYLLASGAIIPLSNYGDGPQSVDTLQAISRFGAVGIAGNAREWTFNESDRSGEHFILGGGWNDETIPVLMLNGRYDFYFPVETSQRPYFDRLGTSPSDKAWMVYDGSHSVPSTQVAKESLAWFDRYLGPLR